MSWLPATSQQDAWITQYIDNRTANPGNYNLVGRNCAEFAADALRSAGLDVPFGVTPNGLMQSLHQLYDTPAPTPPPNVDLILSNPGIM